MKIKNAEGKEVDGRCVIYCEDKEVPSFKDPTKMEKYIDVCCNEFKDIETFLETAENYVFPCPL